MKNRLMITCLLVLPIFFAGPAAALEVPRWLDAENAEPEAEAGEGRFRDASNLMHGVFGFAGLSRTSEAGHDNYRPELAGEPMAERGRLWLDLLREINTTYHRDGRFLSVAGQGDDTTEVFLRDYPHGVYAYHMHHRAGRWADHGLEEAIVRAELLYQVRPAIYLINEHFAEGRFYHDREHNGFDKNSMVHGLAGLHGTVYGWVRWAKPDGAEDMGALPEDRLAGWFGITPNDLAEEVARPAAEVLLKSWDSTRRIYRLDDDDTWSLEALGSLLRGSKAVYETLYMFGDGEKDRAMAEELARHAANVLEGLFTLSRQWGLPEKINFTEEGPAAASDKVDTEAQWSFVNHLGSGFALLSEEEGMSDFIANGPLRDVPAAIGREVDGWLEFTLERGLADGYLPETYAYADGAIKSARHAVAAAGIFVVAASNNYRRGEMFERASDWDDVPSSVVERSRKLYDTLLAHVEKLEGLVLRD